MTTNEQEVRGHRAPPRTGGPEGKGDRHEQGIRAKDDHVRTRVQAKDDHARTEGSDQKVTTHERGVRGAEPRRLGFGGWAPKNGKASEGQRIPLAYGGQEAASR